MHLRAMHENYGKIKLVFMVFALEFMAESIGAIIEGLQ